MHLYIRCIPLNSFIIIESLGSKTDYLIENHIKNMDSKKSLYVYCAIQLLGLSKNERVNFINLCPKISSEIYQLALKLYTKPFSEISLARCLNY